MKRRDPDMPFGRMREIKNFLPPPSELVFPKDTNKVTINLSISSLNFFKKEAKKQGVKYQQMIRAALDAYAGRFSSQ